MKQSKTGPTLKNQLKSLFTKNLAIKIASFFFAMLLWGYVLTAQNPARIKTINYVPIIFEGEADLRLRNLVIANEGGTPVNTISVQVDTELAKYADLSAANITATVNLKSITATGTYELPIMVTTTEGTIRRASVTPNTITVVIDRLVTKGVPVNVAYTGTLPNGYWHDAPELTRNEIEITGPSRYVNRIAKAMCNIPLDGRTSSFTESIELVLMDEEGAEVDRSFITDKLPTVSVKMNVLRALTLPVNLDTAVLGADTLPANYEVSNITCSPSFITVVGTEEALAGLTSVEVLPINIEGLRENVTSTVPLILPEGVSTVNESAVTVYISISEKQKEATYTRQIEVDGLSRRMEAVFDPKTAEITVTGRQSVMNKLEISNVRVYINVAGLAVGEHECEVLVAFSGNDDFLELRYVIAPQKITVTIRPAG